MESAMRRSVFYISDGTGISAETIGHSVLTQFDGIDFATSRMPFVDTLEKAEHAARRIREEHQRSGVRPIVINTIMDPQLSDVVATTGALMLDVFAPFIGPLEAELGAARSSSVGKAHGLHDFAEYEARISATNYALSHDDGVALDYAEADVILVGVSRVGKTPTCLYMALHFGIKAGNYPLTPDDLERQELPRHLDACRQRLFGLTIDAERLRQVREERRPGSSYATIEQCRWELAQADRLLRGLDIPVLSTTHTSIEEIGSKILDRLGIHRNMY